HQRSTPGQSRPGTDCHAYAASILSLLGECARLCRHPSANHAVIRKRLIQNRAVRFPIGLITAAGSSLESTPIEHRDIAAAVVDELLLLQRACGLGHTDPGDAEHERHDFLRDLVTAHFAALF